MDYMIRVENVIPGVTDATFRLYPSLDGVEFKYHAITVSARETTVQPVTNLIPYFFVFSGMHVSRSGCLRL